MSAGSLFPCPLLHPRNTPANHDAALLSIYIYTYKHTRTTLVSLLCTQTCSCIASWFALKLNTTSVYPLSTSLSITHTTTPLTDSSLAVVTG